MTAVLKYNAGNIGSVRNALARLGAEHLLTADPALLRTADRVIIPGVGEASSAMAYLKVSGLDAVIRSLRQPVLGICLGQQLLCAHSEENDTECLGVFDTRVRRFPPRNKVPHMGWNSLRDTQGPLFREMKEEDVYFVHSYYCETDEHTAATCDYILPFAAAMQRDNFYATQFHPEKSAGVGAEILKNFLSLF